MGLKGEGRTREAERGRSLTRGEFKGKKVMFGGDGGGSQQGGEMHHPE